MVYYFRETVYSRYGDFRVFKYSRISDLGIFHEA